MKGMPEPRALMLFCVSIVMTGCAGGSASAPHAREPSENGAVAGSRSSATEVTDDAALAILKEYHQASLACDVLMELPSWPSTRDFDTAEWDAYLRLARALQESPFRIQSATFALWRERIEYSPRVFELGARAAILLRVMYEVPCVRGIGLGGGVIASALFIFVDEEALPEDQRGTCVPVAWREGRPRLTAYLPDPVPIVMRMPFDPLWDFLTLHQKCPARDLSQVIPQASIIEIWGGVLE